MSDLGEIIYEYGEGRISDYLFVLILKNWAYKTGWMSESNYPVEGSFDEVSLAHKQGLIPEHIYRQITLTADEVFGGKR